MKWEVAITERTSQSCHFGFFMEEANASGVALQDQALLRHPL